MSEEKKVESQEGANNDSSKDIEIPAKFKDLVTQIEQLSVLDLAELVKVLEEKFGVSASAPVMAMTVAPAGDGGGAEEKTSFDVEITDIGSSKINVIKAVRALTELGLKDAKDLVDKAPVIMKEGAKKEEAEAIKAKIEEAGGKVTLK